MNRKTTRTSWLWRVLLSFTIGAGFLAATPGATPARSVDSLDLAALILHADDLDWLIEEMGPIVEEGYPFGQDYSTSHTSIDEAVAHEMYGLGRGGLTLDLMGEQEASELLEHAGWVRAQTNMLFIPDPSMEGNWSHGLAVTIEEFTTENGAEESLSWFNDTELLAKLTDSATATMIEPALEIDGVKTNSWNLVTYRYGNTSNISTLWAQVDNMVVSVALMNSDLYDAPNPDLLVPLVELQLQRLKFARYYYQPSLSLCAPELEGSQVTDWRAEYVVLSGTTFALFPETLDDLTADQAKFESQGIINIYVTEQSIEGTEVGVYDGKMWLWGQVMTFTDNSSAGEYVAKAGDRLKENFTKANVEKIDDLPDLGDGAVVYNYDGIDDFPASVIVVQVDDMVIAIRLSSMNDFQPEAVIELANAQLDRMNGNCNEPLELPRSL